MTVKKTLQVFHKLHELSGDVFVGKLDRDGAYQCALKAAVSKALDTTITIWNSSSRSSFVNLGALRSMCEDLIVFSFLESLARGDRDALIVAMMHLKTFENIEKQEAFFEHSGKMHPVLTASSFASSSTVAKDEIERIRLTYSWKSGRELPTTKGMAIATGLEWLYEYVFAATSSIVHFDPAQLLRMGWGSTADGEMHFDVSHFRSYYRQFGRFFSTLLLTGFYKRFYSALNIPPEVRSPIELLENDLLHEVRWPELVTFEEMNVNGPSQIIFVMSAAASNIQGIKPLFDWA